jgi:hypothetical protein
MECYEGAKMIKTYRGQLIDGGQDKINLKTLEGKIGYRIVKFQTMSANPYATDTAEHITKIYKIAPSAVDGAVNFTDGDLLAAAIVNNHTNGFSDPSIPVIIFDQEIFNQDIYVTHFDAQGAVACNYYIELEQVMLNENETTMATLQSLRRFALPRN